jgi:predicted nucleotidyltransferase
MGWTGDGSREMRQDNWTDFKRTVGDGDFESALYAVDEALVLLRKKYGPELVSVMLFGSLARKSRTYDDIDLLLVTDQNLGSTHEVTKELSQEIFGQLFWEHGELFSFVVYSKAQFEGLRGQLPLLDEVEKDRVLLYGQDLFAETSG